MHKFNEAAAGARGGTEGKRGTEAHHCGRKLSRRLSNRAAARQWGSRKAVWVPELCRSP